MANVIVTENSVGKVSVIYPTEQALSKYTIKTLAEKDVPEGDAFWILDSSELPQNHVFFEAWEIDKDESGEPDGYGKNLEEWMEENL